MAINFPKGIDCDNSPPPGGLGPYARHGTADDEALIGGSVLGGPGDDTITGTSGDDSLNGGIDSDIIIGGSGNDFLTGNAGNDSLYGGAGNDTLRGDAGNDTLYGGAGADTFFFGAVTGDDMVADFGVHDVIDARGMGLSTWAAVEAHLAYTDEGAVLSVGANTVLLEGVTSLSANDFVF